MLLGAGAKTDPVNSDGQTPVQVSTPWVGILALINTCGSVQSSGCIGHAVPVLLHICSCRVSASCANTLPCILYAVLMSMLTWQNKCMSA